MGLVPSGSQTGRLSHRMMVDRTGSGFPGPSITGDSHGVLCRN